MAILSFFCIVTTTNTYRISSYSFRGNYSFLNLEIQRSQYKNNLEDRENKIKDDIEHANKFKELSELKMREYGKILENAKKEVTKIHIESKNSLDKDIKIKKEIFEKEIEKEILKAQKEIKELKKSSISDIQKISENIASNIIETISGDKLNESSIKAAVEDISKKNVGKYL